MVWHGDDKVGTSDVCLGDWWIYDYFFLPKCVTNGLVVGVRRDNRDEVAVRYNEIGKLLYTHLLTHPHTHTHSLIRIPYSLTLSQARRE